MTLIKRLWNKLFYFDKWRIGLVDLGGEESFFESRLSKKIKWLSITNYNYEADPFVFYIDSKAYIAFEVLDLLHGNGKIMCIDLEGNNYDYFENINMVRGHKSYPYIFQSNDNVYCLPETSDQEKLTLYQYEPTLCKFVALKDILKGRKFVDSNILEKDGYFYLFTSNDNDPFVQELYVSKSILGPYLLHDCSPIASGKRFGRNGGSFYKDKGKLFRVSQDCTLFYGEKLVLSEVLTLTKDKFIEKEFCEIKPFEPYSKGVHNLSIAGDYIVIDGKVSVFNVFNPFKKIIFRFLVKFNIEFRY